MLLSGCGGSGTPREGQLPTARAPVADEPHRVELLGGMQVETLEGRMLTIIVRSPPAPVGRRVRAEVELRANPPYFLFAGADPTLSLSAPDGVLLDSFVAHPARVDRARSLPRGREAVTFEIPLLLERASASGRAIEVRASFVLCGGDECDPGTASLAIPVKAP